MSKREFGRVADPNPAIIEHLRVIRHHGSTAEELQRAYDYIDATLADWLASEDVEALRDQLGVASPKKRRRQATVNIENKIALAVMTAALNGSVKPLDTVATQTGHDMKRVERAWKEWRGFCLMTLDAMAVPPSPFVDQAKVALRIFGQEV